jgi:hypothetical protein
MDTCKTCGQTLPLVHPLAALFRAALASGKIDPETVLLALKSVATGLDKAEREVIATDIAALVG